MMLAAMLAVALLAASPALAQDEPAVVADAKAKEAKAGCEPEPPKAAPAPAPPPPKAVPAAPAAPAPAPAAPAPAPAPAEKALPPSGGISTPGLIALGAGALLVGGGLLARRFVR